jgi:hypothetical protein
MALMIQQLQASLGAGGPESHVEGAVPGEVTYRSVDELRKAKAEIEADIRQASGQTGSRVTLAQHKRRMAAALLALQFKEGSDVGRTMG